METLTIKLKDDKARKLIQDLEDLDILQVIRSDKPNTHVKLSELLIGSISEEQGKKMHDELKNIREEWERGI